MLDCGKHKLHIVRVRGNGDVRVDLGPAQASGEIEFKKIEQTNFIDILTKTGTTSWLFVFF